MLGSYKIVLWCGGFPTNDDGFLFSKSSVFGNTRSWFSASSVEKVLFK